ncbi:MAG TPA: PAS domain S-box protein [Methanospirillum sp.]|nr:PAS domain S-box protein [Methanospirillum sp.]
MTEKIHVLYVDDEQDLLTIGRLFLERLGKFTVTVASGAAEAIVLLKEQSFDVIVSDYQMPKMDGIAFLKHLKSEKDTTPFILFTGRGREEVVIEALNNGAEFYLQKGGEPRAQFTELAHKIHSATSRQRTEKLAKETEKRLFDIINFLPDATFAIDNEGRVIAWNIAIEEMTGIPARDMLGKGDHEYSIPFYGERRPILIDLVSVPDEELSGSRYAVVQREGGILIAETALPRPLGRYCVLLGKASLLYNDKGEVIGAIESIRDVTEQKRMQEELRKSHDEFIDLLEHMNDVFYRSDNEGRLILASRSWAQDLGYDDLSECLFKNIADTFYAVPGERKRLLEELYRNGSVVDYEVLLKKKDGTPLPVATSSYLFFDESGAVLGVAGTWRDISGRKQAEDALRESQRQLDAMATNIPGVVYRFTVNPDGKFGFDYISKRSRQILGLENNPETFFVQFMQGIVEKDRKRFLSSIQQVISTKSLWEFESEYIKPSGKHIAVSAVSSPVIEGDRLIFDGVIFDNTERHHAELELLRKNEELHGAYEELTATEEELRANLEDLTRHELELRESKRELADIIDFLPDATFAINLEGTVVAWNRAIEEMTGVPAPEMIGKGNYEYALPFYRERRGIMIDLILHDDSSVAAKYPAITKKGNYLFSDVFIPHFNNGRGAHFWFTACPLYDMYGNLKGAIESIRDITERMEAEKAIAESEEKYRNVVEDQTELICRFLPDGVHIFVNDAYCRYFHMSRDELIGHHFTPRIHPDDLQAVSRHIASLTPDHPVSDIDQRIIMADGIRWQRWSDRAIFDHQGVLKEYQSVGRDITEFKQTEFALASANKNLNLLSSITRHDINNQLTALMGYLEILNDIPSEPAQKECIVKVSTAAERISAMIRFTKVYEDIGLQAPTWQECSALVEIVAQEAPLGSVTMIPDLPSGIEVFADPLIIKVFYNLVDNAVRHGGKIKSIRFSALKRGSDLVVVCEDDGDGVPAEDKEKIFERGYGKNTGHGLFLSREILSITGLTIRECGDFGKGARFEILIPAGKCHMPGEEAS